MLAKIFIKNYALIQELQVELSSGLQVITGETGAGKSIILGALRLIMGERSESQTRSEESKKSIVEASFTLEATKFKNFFEANDLDFWEETIIRREINRQGKSRAFINDTPVTLQVLKSLSKELIDIHSQFETSILYEEGYQFKVLDGLAGQNDLLKEYQREYQDYISEKQNLKKLQQQLVEHTREADYHQFLLTELREAHLEDIDLEEVKTELSKQEHAEAIIGELSESFQLLQQDEYGVLERLSEVKNKLTHLSSFGENYVALEERLTGLLHELHDISAEFERELEEIQIDPQYRQSLNEQLNTVNTLLVKHQAADIDELRSICQSLSDKENDTENLVSDIEISKERIAFYETSLQEKAQSLDKNRQKAADIFVGESTKILKRLGLEKAKLQFEITPAPDFNLYGKNKLAFLFQANPGFPLLPIKKAVSGGERARVMFAVKKIMAENTALPTLILDEIDAGISGRIGEEMGLLMKDMGKDLQLIVITHLPQIAAKGSVNYKVVKEATQGKTQTTIKRLSDDERTQEVAQLLSGNKITEAALKQAQELMR